MIRKSILFITFLAVIDQCVKLIVFRLFMDMHFVLVPNVLFFHPVQNKHLSFLGSLFDTKIPLIAMILLEVIVLIIMIMIYRYCMFIFGKHRRLLIAFLCFGLAGIFCGFIDNVFWGGSIDFIRLFNWFTFDLKDVYLSTMVTLIVLFGLYYTPEYYKLSKEDRKKTGIIIWIRSGCPAKHIV